MFSKVEVETKQCFHEITNVISFKICTLIKKLISYYCYSLLLNEAIKIYDILELILCRHIYCVLIVTKQIF